MSFFIVVLLFCKVSSNVPSFMAVFGLTKGLSPLLIFSKNQLGFINFLHCSSIHYFINLHHNLDLSESVSAAWSWGEWEMLVACPSKETSKPLTRSTGEGILSQPHVLRVKLLSVSWGQRQARVRSYLKCYKPFTGFYQITNLLLLLRFIE